MALLCTILSACAGSLGGITPEPTDTARPTATFTPVPSATIVWFPPTRTPTLQPTLAQQVQPTQEPRPNLGNVVLQDSFIDKTGWQSGVLGDGTAAYGNNSLSLVIPDAAATLISLHRAALPQDDYYLEITVTANLCRGKDAYGLIFRSDGGTLNGYRWILTCDGNMRVERWRVAEAAVVQNWVYFGDGGAPLVIRLGLWLVHDEMRFFVNDTYLFSAHDPLLTGSQIGVFAKSTGQNALSVSFSNLVVRSITGYVPTPIPSPTVYVTLTSTRAPTWTPVH